MCQYQNTCKTNIGNICQSKCYNILNNIEQFIWYVEEPEKLKFVNRSFADFFGKDKTFFENKHLIDIMSREQYELCLNTNLKVFQTCEKIITEEWVTNKDNIERLWKITRIPKLSKDNKVEYFIATADDITDKYYKENLYENLINNISDIIFIINLEGLLTFVSPSVTKQLGYTVNDVINTHFIDYVHEQDISKRILKFNKLIPDTNTLLEFRVKTKNKLNEHIWMRSNVKPYMENNQLIGIYGILSNIHDMKLKEIELQSIFDNEVFSIFISKNGICVNQNKTAEKMFGYTLEEAVGKPGIDWIDEKDKQRVRENMIINYDGLYSANGVHKNGKIFKIIIQGNPFDINGEIYRMTFIRKYVKNSLK